MFNDSKILPVGFKSNFIMKIRKKLWRFNFRVKCHHNLVTFMVYHNKTIFTNYACRHYFASSAVCWQSNVLGQEITQPVPWPLFCHRRANAMEQSVWTASDTGLRVRTIQTIVENVCLVSWAAAPCLWTLRSLTKNLTYLITYLLTSDTRMPKKTIRASYNIPGTTTFCIWSQWTVVELSGGYLT